MRAIGTVVREVGESSEGQEVFGKTPWRRHCWRWRGEGRLSRGSHFPLPSLELLQLASCPALPLSLWAGGGRPGACSCQGSRLSSQGRIGSSSVTWRVGRKAVRIAPREGLVSLEPFLSCVPKTLRTRKGMDIFKKMPQGHKVVPASSLPPPSSALRLCLRKTHCVHPSKGTSSSPAAWRVEELEANTGCIQFH